VNDFKYRLERINWSPKFNRYKKLFSYVKQRQLVKNPKISIIIISWRFHPDTLATLEILEKQRGEDFELIFVDNGSPHGSFEKIENHIDTYLKLNNNTGSCVARNFGAVFANSPILFFLDDDGIPNSNIVSAHLKTHARYDVVSVRGVCLPKNLNNPFNSIAKHYYLGDSPFPRYTDLEGNSSYRAEPFFAVGGWDDETYFGHEGVELSLRLWRYEPDCRKQIYSPEPILRHDYAVDNDHFQQKTEKISSQMKRIEYKNNGFKEFLNMWKQFYLKSDILKLKNPDQEKKLETGKLCTQSVVQVPMISIVIPTHNRCHFLKQTLESAFGQTAKNYEVVVVDDGSTDGTRELLHGLSNDRLRCRFKSQTGAPDTRNCGIEAATGQYILWLDDDDVLAVDAVAKHSEIIQQHPEVDVVYGVLQYFEDESGKNLGLFDPKDFSLNSDILLSSLVAGNCIPNPGTMVRRSCYKKVGPYDTLFTRAHDYELWSRAAGHFKFKKNHTIICRYRIHNTNLSGGRAVDHSFESLIIRRMVANYGIKKIYHWFDWSNSEAAEVAALYTVANNLFIIGDSHHCAMFLEQIPFHLWNTDIAELGLNCMLFQGRWKNHRNILEHIKKRNIISPQRIKFLQKEADQYRRINNGLRRVLDKKNLQKVAAYLKIITENKNFPLAPDCAVKMTKHLLNFTNDRNESFSSSMSFKLLQRALLADPKNKSTYQEVIDLPVSDADRELIESIHKRMLTEECSTKNVSSGADRDHQHGNALREAATA